MKKIAIVGRPNVGKSALFNRIVGKKVAIVEDFEGVTRDRLIYLAQHNGISFQLIDTGGIDKTVHSSFAKEVLAQTQIAIEQADIIIMVVDAQAGLTALDLEVATLIKKTRKKIYLAVNKVDSLSNKDMLLTPFYNLGISKMIPVSAVQDLQIDALLDCVLEGVTQEEEKKEKEVFAKVAIVGRANTGKSTLFNQLLEESRSAVSDIPGTTRDSIDEILTIEGKDYLIIDTAGIRRTKKEKTTLEKFAHVRTVDAVKRADVCLLLLDAQEGITLQDKKIINLIQEENKGCIVLLNKWDLVKGVRMEHFTKELKEDNLLRHAPMVVISAKTKRNLEQIFPLVQQVKQDCEKRLGTGPLNKFLEKCMQTYHPPMIQGKRLRIYYLTQVGTAPPHFVLFVNARKLLTDSYKQYLINALRKEFSFMGVTISFSIKSKAIKEKAKEILV